MALYVNDSEQTLSEWPNGEDNYVNWTEAVEKGDSEALKEILYPTLSNEYIPVQEAIKNYSERIKDYKIYDEKFPTSPLKDKEEYKSMLLIIKDYINILTDDNYTEKFKPYYNEVKGLFDVKRIVKKKEKVLSIKTK